MSQKNGLVGLIVGIAAGVAAATAGGLAALKVANEIKDDSHETTIVSPNEENLVKLTCGSSTFAKGLTLIKVKAENGKEHCDFSFLVGKNSKIAFNWVDDNNCEVFISDSKLKRICNISFGEEIAMKIYAEKLKGENA